MALPFSEPGAELHQETRCSQPSDQRAHIQEHYVPSAIVRNIILGFADGLTVPFALTAGLSSSAIPCNILLSFAMTDN